MCLRLYPRRCDNRGGLKMKVRLLKDREIWSPTRCVGRTSLTSNQVCLQYSHVSNANTFHTEFLTKWAYYRHKVKQPLAEYLAVSLIPATNN